MAERIVRLRNAIGLDRAKWARKIGVSYQTAFDWEQGKYPPKRENAERIADACGISVDEVLGRGAPPEARDDIGLPPVFSDFYTSPIGADTTDEEKQRLQDRRWREGLELTLEDLFSFRTMIRNAKKRGLPPLTDQEQELERTRIAKGRPRNVLVGAEKSPPPRPRTKPRPKR